MMTLLMAVLMFLAGQGPVAPPAGGEARQPAQIPQNGKGAIEGIVKRPDNGEPVGEVQVRLLAIPTEAGVSGQLMTSTDGGGRFSFRNLPEGHYTVSAQREGYFIPANGTANGIPVVIAAPSTLAATQAASAVTIHLTPGGTINGSVRDADGEFVTGITVAALRVAYQDGRRRMQSSSSATTDDRGQFRIWGLAAGEYHLRVEANSNPMAQGSKAPYATTYYPGIADPQNAQLIRIRGGDNVVADMRAIAGNPVRITGSVINTIPELTGGDAIGFLLVPRDQARLDEGTSGSILPNVAKDRTNGRFEIIASRPGEYNLMPVVGVKSPLGARPNPTSGQPNYYTARMPIDVRDRDIEGLALTLARSADLDLRVTENGLPPTSAQNLRVSLRPKDGVTPLTQHLTQGMQIPSDGITRFSSVPEGLYSLSVPALPAGVYIADVRQGGRSVYETGGLAVGREFAEPVEIVLADGGVSVSGIVEGAADKTSVWVTLAPQGARRENLLLYRRTTTVSREGGRFNLDDVAPGDYKLFAWEDLPAHADENGEFLAQYEKFGLSVSISAGMPVSVGSVPMIPSSLEGQR